MKKTPEQREKEFIPTLFFGYGSLMAPEGINPRGMRKTYKRQDLIPCELSGYERAMSGFFRGRNFYGITENKTAKCNGIVFEVDSWRDYRELLYTEGATSAYRKERAYWPVRVNDLISGISIPKGYRVMALVCKKDRSGLGKVERTYIARCHAAALKLGEKFEKRFLATGGVPFDPKNMTEIAKTYNLKLWRY